MEGLLNLAGAVALLLWGTHMVRSGVMRAYGSRLRATLGASLRTRPAAFLAGLGVTLAVQSSTATALMTGGFAAHGLVGLTSGLAIMLGANVGSSLIVPALSFNTSALSACLLVAGWIAFRRPAGRAHHLGRAAIGLGLMLLALHLLIAGITTALSAETAALWHTITREPVIACAVTAVLACAAHSGVATILLVIAMASTGLVTPASAIAMVAGANLGSAINPVLTFRRDNVVSRRLALGNLITRLAGCAIVIPLVARAAPMIAASPLGHGPTLAAFNVAFNLAVAAIFLPLLPVVSKGLAKLVPAQREEDTSVAARSLDTATLDDPPIALATATRAALDLVDGLTAMLREAHGALNGDDRRRAQAVRRMDDGLDRTHAALEAYLVRINESALSPEQTRRRVEILAFSMNLEHAGDIVERSLVALTTKKIKGQVRLPGHARRDIDAMFAQLTTDLDLAATVLMTGDLDAARRLFEAKEGFRRLEQHARERHIARMCAGEAGSLASSGLFLDLVRDLKRIESHVAAAAQPILQAHDQLHESRLLVNIR